MQGFGKAYHQLLEINNQRLLGFSLLLLQSPPHHRQGLHGPRPGLVVGPEAERGEWENLFLTWKKQSVTHIQSIDYFKPSKVIHLMWQRSMLAIFLSFCWQTHHFIASPSCRAPNTHLLISFVKISLNPFLPPGPNSTRNSGDFSFLSFACGQFFQYILANYYQPWYPPPSPLILSNFWGSLPCLFWSWLKGRHWGKGLWGWCKIDWFVFLVEIHKVPERKSVHH